MSLSGLSEESPVKQVQALTLCSRKTLTIVDNLGLTTEARKSVTSIINAIKKYIAGHINELVGWQNFCRRTQQPEESFDDHLPLENCSDSCTQKSVCVTKLSKALLDGDTVKHLLQEKGLTLEKTINMCEAQEAAKKQRATIQQEPSHLHDSIAALKTQKPFTLQHLCPGCGAQPHPAGHTQCPAYCVSCHNCKKLGHFSRVCHSKPVNHNGTKLP